MSTVPEVLVAKHMNTALIVNSVVANVCYPIEAINETSVEDVIREVNKTAPKLEHLVEEMIDTLKSKA
jgi:purine nucleoside phosphorylase